MFAPFLRVALSGLAVLVATPAAATVALESTVPQLAQQSEVVARGRVEKKESRMSKRGGRIYTLVTVDVTEPWKGAPSKKVTIRVPGGEVEGLAQVVHGMPVFEENEEVVVFLEPLAPATPEAKPAPEAEGKPGPVEVATPPSPMRVVGLAQGKMRVEQAEGTEVLIQDLSGLELVSPETRAPVEVPRRRVLNLPKTREMIKAAPR